MSLLATLKTQDIEPDIPRPDYTGFMPRSAVRAIVFDGIKIALLKVNLYSYYMLPGGGIDDGEDQYEALAREAQEELGCKVQILEKVGDIVSYNDRWKQIQTDFCYTARLVQDMGNINRADNEIEEGHELIWVADIDNAIKLLQNATPSNREGKLLTARGLIFLKTVKANMKKRA